MRPSRIPGLCLDKGVAGDLDSCVSQQCFCSFLPMTGTLHLPSDWEMISIHLQSHVQHSTIDLPMNLIYSKVWIQISVFQRQVSQCSSGWS